MEFLRGIFGRIRGWFSGIWEKTEKRDRTRFLVISSIALVLIIAAWMMLNNSRYTELTTISDPASFRAATGVLTDNKISYKTSGNTILVNKKYEIDAAMFLAQSDDVFDGVDISIYEAAMGLTSTDADRRMLSKVQVESNINKMLMKTAFIAHADIQLNYPDNKNVYHGDEEPRTAAAMLVTTQDITRDQVNTVESVISRAAGVLPENIEIMDQYMRNLNKKDEDSFFVNMGKGYEYKLRYEQDLEKGFAQMLTPLYGSNNFRVSVAAKFNHDSVTEHKVVFEPVVDEDGIPRSTMEILEHARGLGLPGGFPGTDPNGLGMDADEYVEMLDQTMSEYDKQHRSTNYEINETNTTTIRDPVVLERINASVVINSNGLEANEMNAAAIQSLLGAILLLPPSEYRNISVEFMPMKGLEAREAELEKLEEEQKRQETYTLIQTLVLYGIIGICIILIILRTFAFLKPPVVEVPMDLYAGDAGEYTDLLEAAQMTSELEVTKTPSRERIEEFINSNPEAVATMLRAWLQDEEDRSW
ncbi:MAG: hypothetical protein FWG31_03920 [Oscillospiraceae bacterium]|nr:hypothetical protein [Oscillospiraceae bacterium]